MLSVLNTTLNKDYSILFYSILEATQFGVIYVLLKIPWDIPFV